MQQAIATRKRTALTERQLFYVGKPGETFIHDETLPSLPVAPLDDALQIYLDSVKPLVNDEEFSKTEGIVNNFKEGIGRELHTQLVKKSKTEKNWLEKWWEDNAYLTIRFPMIPYLNMSGCLPIEGYNTPNRDQWLNTGGLYIHLQMQFWKLVRSEKLRPFVNRGVPWSMNQFRNLFNTSRIPGESRDEIFTCFKTESEGPAAPLHIIVLCQGHIFAFNTIDEHEEPLSPPEITSSLQSIYDYCQASIDGPYVGALTATDRKIWAKNRKSLIELHPTNKYCLEKIDTALFALILDNQEPQNNDEMLRYTLCAENLNRWADKAFTTFLFRNGLVSGGSDHAPYDGMVSMTFSHYMQVSVRAYGGEWQGTHKIRDLPKPQKLDFHIDDSLETEIQMAKDTYRSLCLNIQTKFVHFNLYGKSFTKPYNIRPEAYVQLSIQLAYYRTHGKPAPTYMTASTRQFYHGRTETCRTCTSECLEWVKAMDDSECPVSERVTLMYRAVDKFNSLLMACMKGHGSDRLLLGLYMLAVEGGMSPPELYQDPSYAISGGGGNFILSTSCAGYTPLTGAVAPMTEKGYGTFYSIENNRIGFQLSAFNHYAETDTDKFYASIEMALKDMQSLLISAKL